MGVVYRARDPIINRLVALKTITAGIANDPNLLERFYREAQSAGGLQHPNIVTIYDMGEEAGTPYIAMELVEGESLDQVIGRRPPHQLPLKLVYAQQACRAFDYAHKRGIIHRDIKPGNVMVNREGIVKVVDFGIARVLESSHTQTGMLMGTFAYMSPEQYRGERADERSDIWSFGVLLYELLSYQRPFAGETGASLMYGICQLEPRAIRELVPDCLPELEAVIHRLLRKTASDRYQSMEDLLLDLDPICKSLQSASVAELVAQSRELVERSEYQQARDLLRQALQVDSANPQARMLLEKVNVELKRLLLRPKARQHVERGRILLGEGKIQEAKAEAEGALQLDSNYEPAQELQRLVQRELDRAQLVADWLQASKQHLAEGLPEEAEVLLAKVLEIEPSSTQGRSLLQQVLKEKEVRKRRLRLLEEMQRARGLWTQQNYSECIELLAELQKEFPDEDEIQRLLDTAREDEAEQHKLKTLEKARNLLAARHYEESKALLTGLRKQFPSDEEIPKLLDDVREDQTKQRRLQGLAEARSALAARRFEESIALLTDLGKEFPDDGEISRLLTTARDDQAEQRKLQGLADARDFLASRSYEECIALLNELRKEFPKEAEIPRLLASASEERAEQQKQQRLADARALLASQQFGEALSVLEVLRASYPKDAAVQKLSALVQHEQEKRAKFEWMQREWEVLKKLVGDKKYSETISRAEKLLGEFPGDTDLARLVEFARNQQAQAERELRLRNVLGEAKGLFDANRFADVVRAAQAGLKLFPENPDLLNLRQQAEAQQKKLETRQSIEQRIREIKFKINREKFSEAIEMAKQTLVTLGPDTDVTQLLNSAQIEYQARERRREQERKLAMIRALMESRKLDQAAQTLDDALATLTLDSFDPRVQRVSEEIEAAKAAATAATTPATPSTPPALSKEYAFLQGPPVESTPTPSETVSAKEMAAAQAAEAAASHPVPLPPSKAPSPPPRVAPIPSVPVVQPIVVPVWKRPTTLSVLALALIAAIWTGVHLLPSKPPKENPPAATTNPAPAQPAANPLEVQQRDAINAADKLVAADDLKGALEKLRQAQALNGPLTAEIKKKEAGVEESMQSESLRKLRQGEEQLWQQAMTQMNNRQFPEAQNGLRQILALPSGGQRKGDARKYLEQIIPQRKQEEKLFAQAQQASQRNDANSLQHAADLLDRVIALDGPRKQDAQQLQNNVRERMTGLAQEKRKQDIAGFEKDASQDLRRGDFRSARRLAEQIKQNGGDPTNLSGQIDQAEQGSFDQSKSQFEKFKQGDDEVAAQQLRKLIPQFQALADSSGPRSDDARSFVADRIPAAVKDVQTRATNKREDEAFQQTVRRYQTLSANDKSGLERARSDFQAIANGGGLRATDAQKYVGEIGVKLLALNQPPREVAPPPAKPEAPFSSAVDRDAIAAVIERFRQAFEQRDRDALRRVWSSMSEKQYAGYKKTFEAASAIHIQVQNETIEFSADGATATVKVLFKQEYTPKGEKTKNLSTPWVFRLAKSNGTWTIIDTR